MLPHENPTIKHNYLVFGLTKSHDKADNQLYRKYFQLEALSVGDEAQGTPCVFLIMCKHNANQTDSLVEVFFTDLHEERDEMLSPEIISGGPEVVGQTPATQKMVMFSYVRGSSLNWIRIDQLFILLQSWLDGVV